MADQDIVFNAGFNLDTSKATENVQKFAKKVDDLFNGLANKLSKSLVPLGPEGYSGLRGLSPLGIAGIASEYANKLTALKKRTGASTKSEYDIIAGAQGINPIRGMESLIKRAKELEKFENLPPRAEQLAQAMINHTLDPKTALGEGGVIQHYLRNVAALMYGTNRAYPGAIPDSALRDIENEMNSNRRVMAYYRHWQTYILNKDEKSSGLQRTLNYMYGSNRHFTGIADMFGINTSADMPEGFVPEEETTDLITKWTKAVRQGIYGRMRIASGNLSPAEERVELKTLTSNTKELNRLGKKLGGQIEFASKQIKRQNDLFIEETRLGNREPGSGNGIWTALAGKVAKDIFGSAGGMLESYWGESITRNAYASRQAYLSRVTTGGKLVGSVLGGLLGALTGNPVAMGVGYAAGGEVGQLFGKYSETKYKADIKSSSDMMGRIRNKALWGNEYNTYFAKALTDVGIANGESAMGGLADKAMSFRARMMLGQVGEQEMLYMSMVPNFYTALMAGVTGPELLNIYKRDLDAIGDPSMRYLVGQSVGNSEAFAAARNPYFSDMYGTLVGKTGLYEGAASGLQYGFYRGRVTAADETLDRDIKEIFYSARRGDKTIYQGELENKSWQKFIDAASSLSKLGGLTGTVLNVVVQLDGADIARATQTIDGPDTYVNSLQSFSIGG